MESLEILKEKINHIEEDLVTVKRTIIKLDLKDRKKTDSAWSNLLSVSKEISKKWKGLSAVEEIRKQREKS